ncbi:MAG: multidrug resistance protein [Candidatus Tectimicrobiota bacterium]|nr:MAG: multidrug resistance protein [Candidatus Tectomicrobia bacterium]
MTTGAGTSAATTLAPLRPRERWLTAGLLGMGLIAFAINASTTNLILADLMTSLRVELYQVHWVLTAFGIARTITIPMLGWLSGVLGPRGLYLACLGTFCVGTLGSALAWDWASLLVFRILTGAGGGMIPPLSMAIFYQIFPPRQRGLALALSLLGWSIGPAVGPLMGGYLLEFASWRVIYSMILPLGGGGLLLAWWLLPPLRRPERRRLDLYGLLSMAVAVTTLLLALSQGNREGWDSQYILTLFVVAGLTGILFVVIELRHPEPLVELRLFRSIPFIMATVVLFLTTMAFRSTGPMLPVLMQRMLGFPPLLVAWTMAPAFCIYGLAVLFAGRLSDWLSPQLLVVGGLILYAGTFIAYAGINELATSLVIATFLIYRFIAEGLIISPNNLTALRALPEHQVMMASGLLGLLRSIANTMGPAVAAVLWDSRYHYYTQRYAEETPLDAAGVAGMVQELHLVLANAGEVPATVPSKAMALVQQQLLAEAGTAAWQDYFLFNALLAVAALVPALLVDERCWKWLRHPPQPARAAAPPSAPRVREAGEAARTQGRAQGERAG